jgi:arabinofuranan 3-O-arabinosyltransferase
MPRLARHPAAAWAAGALVLVAVVFYVSLFRPGAGDLYPNWRAAVAVLQGQPAYAHYDWPYPYLYPPGFILLMLPAGLLPFEVVKQAYLVMNAAGVVVAVVLSLRLVDIRVRNPVTPLVIGAICLTPPVLITLIQGNVNGVLAAGEAAFLLLALRGRWRAAGLVLGVTLLVKPVLLPLVLVPILWRRFDALLVTIAVPVLVSLLALPLLRDPTAFLTVAVPYMLHGESQNELGNTTIGGAFALLHLPAWAALVGRGGAALAGAFVTWRAWRGDGAEVLRLVNVSSALLLVTFLAFSFSSEYYAIYLLPLLVTVAIPGSPVRHALALVGVFLVDSPDLFLFYRLGKAVHVGPAIGTVRSVLGFSLVLAALALAARDTPADPAR